MLLNELKKWRRLPAKAKSLVRNNLPLIYTSVDTDENIAAITFDDGPHPEYTPKILRLFEKFDAKATFFVVGERARKYPEIIHQIKETGHAIGNHTWSHVAVPLISRKEQFGQIRKTQRQLGRSGEKLFRPPWGFLDAASYSVVKLLGYKVICWDHVAYDWLDPSAGEIFERLDAKIRPGSILLLHDNLCNSIKPEYIPRDHLIAGLERYLEKHAASRQFVTVPELLKRGKPQYKYGLLKRSEKKELVPENVL
jgi:peptidoglycan/xylan/chitin deacetylase (PgdA/CDA1 family)